MSVALKDNLCTRGIPTTCSSKILGDWRPPYDATVVTRLPEDLATPLRAAFPALSHKAHTGAELAPELVSRLRDRPAASRF